MSLLDKLKPEHIKNLEQQLELYPTTTQMFIDRVKRVDYPITLQMQDMITMADIIEQECTPLNIFNYFE